MEGISVVDKRWRIEIIPNCFIIEDWKLQKCRFHLAHNSSFDTVFDLKLYNVLPVLPSDVTNLNAADTNLLMERIDKLRKMRDCFCVVFRELISDSNNDCL